MHIKPNPQRAAKLRAIEKGQEGWLKQIWPELQVLHASAGGVYALLVPRVRCIVIALDFIF